MKTEAQTKAAFDTVRYAQCWEDTDVLIEALGLRSGSSVLSICSAGDNSLALLGAGAARVVAVDMSFPQIMLARLKAGTFVALEHEEALRLFGLSGATAAERRGLLERAGRAAGSDVLEYWRARPAAIEAGIASAGKFERYFTLFRTRVLPFVHDRATVEALLRDKPFDERVAFFHERWNTRRWRAMFRIFFSRFVMGRFGRDPHFFDYVTGPVAERIAERAQHALTVLDPAANPYLQWILLGRYVTAWPYLLRLQNYNAIRRSIMGGGFEVFHGSIEEYLERHPRETFDGFNLSDIFEYMSVANMDALLERLLSAGRSRARFVYWNMLAPRSRPESLAERLAPDVEAAHRLHQRDNAFFYSRLVIEEAT